MRYEVGDEVVLRDELQHSGIPDNMKGEKLEISGYYQNLYSTEEGWHISEDRIDHEKTAELQRENYAKYTEEQINDPAYQDLLKEMSKPILDNVNHPSHYKQGKYETIDVIKDITQGFEGYEGYLVGNIVKYLYRANYKGNKVEDLKKGQFYYNKLVEELEDDGD